MDAVPSLDLYNLSFFVCRALFVFKVPVGPHRNIFGVISRKITKSHVEMMTKAVSALFIYLNGGIMLCSTYIHQNEAGSGFTVQLLLQHNLTSPGPTLSPNNYFSAITKIFLGNVSFTRTCFLEVNDKSQIL